jgi:hypothetical protein
MFGERANSERRVLMTASIASGQKIVLITVGGVLALLIAIVAAAFWQTYRSERNAQVLLADMQLIGVNASVTDVRRFIDAHAKNRPVEEIKCTDQQERQCDFVLRFNNRWLARLHLSAPTSLAVGFTTNRDRVVRMGAGLVSRQGRKAIVSAYLADVTEEPFTPDLGHDPLMCDHKLADVGGKNIPWMVGFTLDERATPKQRQRAYDSLNLSCFYKLWGCNDAEALAPLAWRPTDKVLPRDETNAHETQ